MFSYSGKSIAISRIVNADIFVRNFVEIFPGIQSYRIIIIQLKDLYGEELFQRIRNFITKLRFQTSKKNMDISKSNFISALNKISKNHN